MNTYHKGLFRNNYLAGLFSALLLMIFSLPGYGQTPVTITSRPEYTGAVNSAFFIADVPGGVTRKVSGATILASVPKLTDTLTFLATREWVLQNFSSGGGTASSIPWTGVTGTPTTIAGYGITDAYTKTLSDARYGTLTAQNTNTTNISSNTSSIAANTASINTILSYYNGSVIKSTSLPIGSASALGAYKVGAGLSVDVSGVLSTTGGGTQYNLNNIQMFGAAYSASQTFSLPNTPTKVYYVQVWNNSVPMTIPYSAWSLTGSSLTVSSSLSAGDSVVVMYDTGTANGTIASGTPQTGYVPVYQANGSVVWAAQTGGSSGGPTSITLATPNVLYSTPITYNNDGSGNWTGTLSLISQAVHKVFASPLASTGTPIFRYIDSADFGATGQFAAEVQAVPGFGGSGAVTTVGSFNSSSYTNGANITAGAISFGPADLVNPGMVTTSTQTFGGIKSWFNRQVGLSGAAAYGYSFFPDINVTSGTTRGVWIAGYDSSSTGGTRLVFDVGTTNAAQGGGTYTSALKIGTDGSVTTGTANTTIGGSTQFTSNFGNSFAPVNANFYVAAGQGPTTTTLTDASYFGTTTSSFHTNFAGSSPSVTAAPAGYNMFDVNIGTANMDVASTGGTHPLAAGLAIDTPYIRDPGFGTRGTVARIATVYINGAPLKNAVESSQPFSLWIGGTGVFRNDNGVIPGARTTVADANYTLSINDFNVVFTSLTATRSITPPANPQVNQHWKIKDEAGTAGTNNITFVGTLDGATNPAIISTNSGAKTIYWNGTAWFTE